MNTLTSTYLDEITAAAYDLAYLIDETHRFLDVTRKEADKVNDAWSHLTKPYDSLRTLSDRLDKTLSKTKRAKNRVFRAYVNTCKKIDDYVRGKPIDKTSSSAEPDLESKIIEETSGPNNPMARKAYVIKRVGASKKPVLIKT